jgi:hypothetical protein
MGRREICSERRISPAPRSEERRPHESLSDERQDSFASESAESQLGAVLKVSNEECSSEKLLLRFPSTSCPPPPTATRPSSRRAPSPHGPRSSPAAPLHPSTLLAAASAPSQLSSPSVAHAASAAAPPLLAQCEGPPRPAQQLPSAQAIRQIGVQRGLAQGDWLGPRTTGPS